MNKIINVVAIDDNENVLSSVRKYFKDSKEVKVVGLFSNGKEGLKYLINNQNDYDVVLLDILMPQIDGIKMLEELNKRNIEKKIIVLSSFKDDYTIKKMQKLKASYYMLKPIDMKILDERIIDLFHESEEIKYQDNYSVEVEVSSLLHDLGIPSHVRGYKYIREGIMMIYTSKEVVNLVTKDIYPEIANRYNTTSSRVERAIRHAIEISWIRGDLKIMEDIFGNSIDFERSKPTNSEFFTTIADRLKLHQKELVLNANDTSNILNAVQILRDITDTIGSSILAKMSAITANTSIGGNLGETFEQNVHIDANFPNVTNSKEIENAIDNLMNVATQRANRR